ncbi:MAG: hypothetical protein DI564_04160 [Rhodanobacter denitrificans]|uniref:Uncharacterized protein n=1 Tax=Rhodanobacter denitrificans TaxID=666685 RepID=A0A2W5KN68_9GAMM|nr:MAG: hypothetical protein DI564_04160 [Rhodanobacter denitrificans]
MSGHRRLLFGGGRGGRGGHLRAGGGRGGWGGGLRVGGGHVQRPGQAQRCVAADRIRHEGVLDAQRARARDRRRPAGPRQSAPHGRKRARVSGVGSRHCSARPNQRSRLRATRR